jgi:hypothetical protein
MPLQEQDRLLGGRRQVGANFRGVEDPAPVMAAEPTCLYPCVRIVVEPVDSEEEDASDSRHNAALVASRKLEGEQIAPFQPANWLEELGSSSEVDRFRVQGGHRLLVERRDPVVPLHLLDQKRIGPPISGTHTNKNARFRSEAIQVMGTSGAWKYLNGQQMRLSPEDDLDGWDQLGRDAVRDQVGEALFLGQNVGDALDSFCGVFDPDDESAPGGVGESNNRFKRSFRGREVAFELQRLAFGPAEKSDNVHCLLCILLGSG